MAEPTRPEFEILDSEGIEYHRWVSDVETTFLGKDYLSTIKPSTDPKDEEPSDKVKANALMFLRRHIYLMSVISCYVFLSSLLAMMCTAQERLKGHQYASGILRAFAALVISLTATFPNAIFCYLITSRLYSLACALALENPEIKKMVGIPIKSLEREVKGMKEVKKK